MATNDIKGISFPFRFGANGHIVRTSGVDKLISNMKVLISTRLGELPYEPDKGTTGFTRVFRSTGGPQVKVVETLTKQALKNFEPRVDTLRVDVQPKELQTGTALFVRVDFRVRDTQQEGTFELRVGGDV